LEYLKTSLQVLAAFVAHTILHASQHVHSAVSFRIVAGQPANKPTSVFQALDSWALVLSVYPLDSSNKGPDDETYSCAGVDTGRGKDSDFDNRVIYTLLPLQLDMFGSIAVHSQQHHIIHYTPSWPGSQDVTTKLQCFLSYDATTWSCSKKEG
jgi:hypothetical protein